MFAELCEIVDEWIDIDHADGRPLPPPTAGYYYGDKLLDAIMAIEPEDASLITSD